jgi:hypothetical protein
MPPKPSPHLHTHRYPHSHPIPSPQIRLIEVDVPLHPGEQPTAIPVFANSPKEAFRLLFEIGNGVGGTGVRNVYYGTVLEPIRRAYVRRLEAVETAIRRDRAALGPNPTEYELRGLAQWAARQRAYNARLWRLPTPSLFAGLEARDWQKYGVGGRTFENLMARNAAGRTGTAAYEDILGSAVRSNAEVTASVARGARFLRRGGAVLGVTGLAVSAYDIARAPAGQRGAVAQQQALGFAGGLVGSEVAAGLLAIGAGLFAATPPGWVVIGVGLVGGLVGGVISDRIFYPPKHEPIAHRMAAGYAIDPHHHYVGTGLTRHDTGPTVLPVIHEVVITVELGDTSATLSRRAHLQAALSVGLPKEQAVAYASRHASATGLYRVAGDSSLHNDSRVRPSEIATRAGQRVIFYLNSKEREELAALAGRH